VIGDIDRYLTAGLRSVQQFEEVGSCLRPIRPRRGIEQRQPVRMEDLSDAEQID
jgi:hypothetical protein